MQTRLFACRFSKMSNLSLHRKIQYMRGFINRCNDQGFNIFVNKEKVSKMNFLSLAFRLKEICKTLRQWNRRIFGQVKKFTART